MDLFFLVMLAVTPGIAIAIYVYIRDKHEPEPIRLLIISFFLGALSFGLDIGFAFPLAALFNFDEHDLATQALHSFALVAFLEELSKFIFVRGVLYRNKNFNEPLDGIVYAVMVGMGFATAENLLYVYRGGSEVAIVRMFSAIPAHAMFAVLMGYFLGIAKFTHSHQLLYSFAGLLVATIFHGVYDYFLFISFVPGMWIGSLVLLVVAFILSSKAIHIHTHNSPFKDQ